MGKRFGQWRNQTSRRENDLADGEIKLPDGKTIWPMAKSNFQTGKRFGRRRNQTSRRENDLADGEIDFPDGKTISPSAWLVCRSLNTRRVGHFDCPKREYVF